jgi:hypothetical protein
LRADILRRPLTGAQGVLAFGLLYALVLRRALAVPDRPPRRRPHHSVFLFPALPRRAARAAAAAANESKVAVVYLATAPHFETLLVSVYSLTRVAEPGEFAFAVTVHIWWLPAAGHFARSGRVPLALLRSLSPFPIALHVGYCPVA